MQVAISKSTVNTEIKSATGSMDAINKNALKEYLETQKHGLLLAAEEFTREHRDQKSADYCLAQVAFIDQMLKEFIPPY